MQLVEHDALQRREQKRRVVGRQQQRQLFGRGEQDIRRIAPLPLPPRHRRVAGAGLDLDRQTHLGDRRFQIARDIDRERLQRRDVEGVQAAAALHAAAGGDDAASAPSPLVRERGAGCRVRGRGMGGASATPSPDSRARHARPLPRKRGREKRQSSTPPVSAKIRPASCRRRSARSAAPSDRRGLLPAAPADARGATSRGREPAQKRFRQQRRAQASSGSTVFTDDRLSRSDAAGRELKSRTGSTDRSSGLFGHHHQARHRRIVLVARRQILQLRQRQAGGFDRCAAHSPRRGRSAALRRE